MRRGCPDCEYQIQWAEMVREIEAEIHRTMPDWKDANRWPIRELLNAVNDAAALDAEVNGRGHGRKWSIVHARLVDVYRDEKSKPRRIDLWNLQQELKEKE
jgi:hypothetical protein